MATVDALKTSGTKIYSHLTGTQQELSTFARKLNVPVKPGGEKGKEPHLDLNPHKRDLAVRYGAKEE